MKITAIKGWQVDLPLKEGRYSWSNGNFVEVFDATVVAVETDAGITGWGEICPLGPAYLPAYARGARAGIAELATPVRKRTSVSMPSRSLIRRHRSRSKPNKTCTPMRYKHAAGT